MELCNYLLTIHLFLCLAGVTPLDANVTTSKTDVSALLSFKFEISSDPFGVLSSWNESLHHCQWQGVLCGRHHPDRVTALVLDSKQLRGYISPFLANLTFLERVSLSDNQFHGSIPAQLGKLGRLQFLNLSMNFFEGSIPSSLGNCSRLEFIELFNNNLSGHIPPTLGNLTNLIYLLLQQNSLSGTIPSTFTNLNSIQVLALRENGLSGLIPTSIGKLQKLSFFTIYGNNISGVIPHSLYNISAMINLELGFNQLEGTLPFDVCNAFSNLQYLRIFENQLTGHIPPSISNCSALKLLELGNNYFTGIIPSTIGFLQNLQLLLINSNKLEAKIPQDWLFLDALANCTSLVKLDLMANQLQGVIPSSIANLSTSLVKLRMSKNPISGSIPTNIRKLTNLDTLELDDMLLNGTIPEEIGNLFQLQLLDLSNNMISGQIPFTFANMTQMEKLILHSNVLEGSIPPDLSNMQTLQFLNLSNNKLTGKIPKEIMSIPFSIGLDLSHNYLTDVLPPEIGKLKDLQSIHLSNNKLFGELPTTIDGCQVLQYLYLDNNEFQGIIPSSMSRLRGLQALDVSNNNFSGQVPEFMGKMNLLYLNISFNNFEGSLPKEGIFKNLTGIDIRGNPKLCGGVPKLHLPQCISELRTQGHHTQGNIILIISVASSCICLTIGLCLLVAYYLRRSRNNTQRERSLKSELTPVSYHDLVRATKNFSSENLIGRGTFGAVCKAVMNIENEINVAVKVLNLEQHGALKSFFSECEALRNVRHRNLIKVLSSCSSIDQHGSDFKALIFEFMPNGSLEAWLHPNANAYMDQPVKNLNLVQRLSIAIDVATALEYLHYHGPTPIVHCDLKPSNVLLDDEMTAHVGDFGLARFLLPPEIMPSQSITSTGGIKGSIGYIPPEYGMGGRPSVEGDVYSFGILLLEMFTGVSPTDEKLRDGLSLHRHVELAFPEQVMDIVDTNLFSRDLEVNTFSWDKVSGCLLSVIQCGLLCSRESPKDRISAEDVVLQLNSARKKLLSS